MDRYEKVGLAVGAFVIVVWLAGGVAVAVVAIHFIGKYW